MNCEQLRKEDILRILEQILYEFPISAMEFYCPGWVDALPVENPMRMDLIQRARDVMEHCGKLRDLSEEILSLESPYLKKARLDQLGMSDGIVKIDLEPQERFYYETLTEMVGEPINDSAKLMEKLKDYSVMKQEYNKVLDALKSVRLNGYGVVVPEKEEITLERPEIIRQGNKFGVKIKAVSPSIHMIRANIETEIAPIVGSKEQAEDLIGYVTGREASEDMWDTNIFGKSVEQMVNDGIQSKIAGIGPESQEKLQETMQKIVNDINGGMVCIIL